MSGRLIINASDLELDHDLEIGATYTITLRGTVKRIEAQLVNVSTFGRPDNHLLGETELELLVDQAKLDV